MLGGEIEIIILVQKTLVHSDQRLPIMRGKTRRLTYPEYYYLRPVDVNAPGFERHECCIN
jgi:hypothetical protein